MIRIYLQIYISFIGQLFIFWMLHIGLKIINKTPNNFKRITFFLSNRCSQANILHKLHKFRNKLLLQSSTQAWKGYQVLCEQAKNLGSLDNQDGLMKEGLFPPVPGLIYIPNILPPETLAQLTKNSLTLYQLLQKQYNISTSTHKSYNHNLSEDKSYKLLNIEDINQKNVKNESSEHDGPQSKSNYKYKNDANKKIDCQMFVDYGSVDHDLVYFIENKNIPGFVWDCLVSKLDDNVLVKQLRNYSQLNWRLTLNVYKNCHSQQEDQTAFMWHKDIPVNGIITSITTIMGDGYFQIRDQINEKINYRIKLVPGSIVILSGEARWRWIHRVIRIPTQSTDSEVQRISLVLGCK